MGVISGRSSHAKACRWQMQLCTSNRRFLHYDSTVFLSFQYLQNHSQIFRLSPDDNKVSLKEMYHKLQFGSDSQGQGLQSPSQNNDVQWTSESLCTVLKDSASGSHWFDLNDSKVQPIKEKDIEKQFQGKESAYMLFYRKSQLKRPSEGMKNTHHDRFFFPPQNYFYLKQTNKPNNPAVEFLYIFSVQKE